MMNHLKIILLFVAILLTACGEQKKGKREDQAQYKTMVVKKSDQTLVSPYTARLTGRQVVEVRPQVSGCIHQICFKGGQRVVKGQTLFIIDQVPYQAALEVAKANVNTAKAKLATAQMEYESSQTLRSNQVISDYEVQQKLHALNEAKAALSLTLAQEENARNNLSYTVVRSPMSGATSMIPYDVGALVSSSISVPLVTVTEDERIFAYFSITESQALDLIQRYGSMPEFVSKAPAVKLQLANGTVYEQEGHLDSMSGTIDEQTGAVQLRAIFNNDRLLLRNGGSATVLLPTHKKGCIVIPQTATYELQNRMFVYRVVDGKAKATPVEVFRLNNGHDYIVEEGLSEGDVIVSEGAGLIKDGAEIKKSEGRRKREEGREKN